jgi:hypothetical protein
MRYQIPAIFGVSQWFGAATFYEAVAQQSGEWV